MDIVSSIQKVIEEIVIRIASDISTKTREDNLCLAGGVALNCVINGILLREKYLKIFGYNLPLVMRVVPWEQLFQCGIFIIKNTELIT